MSWRAVRWTLVAALVVGALVVWRRPAQQQLVIRYGPPAYTCGPAPARPALRFAMITVLPNEDAEAWRVPLAAKSVYAAKHGYHHIVEPMPAGMSLPEIAWQAPLAVMRYLPDYDWVMVVAERSYVVNLSVKLESFVTPDAHVVVGDEDGPMLLSRLVMVRNSEQGHAFMKRWWSQLERIAGEAWMDYDNGAFVQTVLETVTPPGLGTEACFAHAVGKNFVKYSECAKALLDEKASLFGNRVSRVIRFLPPKQSWVRYCDEDMTERGKLNEVVSSVRTYHAYREGDFLVMCREPPTGEGRGNAWMERVFMQTQALQPQLTLA